MPAALLDYCRTHQDWLIHLIETLVTIESPTDDKAAVDRCGDELDRQLRAIGMRTTRVPAVGAGDHLLAEIGDAGPRVLLLGHFDTVWPVGQLARMPLERRDGRLHGPGVFDMKTGIGLGMLAVRALGATGTLRGRVAMLWTTDEETGSGTSRALVEREAKASDAVLVLEPALPGGAVKTRRKGCGQFEVVTHGIAAHAGIDPGKGVSAIAELARQILAIEALADLPNGVSVNVGVIAGGSRPNVVAEEARALVDVRAPTMAQAEAVVAAMRALVPRTPGARVDVTGGFERPPLERTAGVARLYDEARSVAAALGVTLDEGGTGGGSDGNFCAALGVPTLDGLGAVGDGAHALHEHVELASLPLRAALLAGLIGRVTEERPGGR
ncbi:MAG: M20 family metallopeptidase [Vicinamibacterales bacterium]|nr:M20 family metallopeptidase [Vicinamibacterales bacterium]